MGYLFLAISVIAGSVKGYCGKRTSAYVERYEDAMIANTLRMLICIVIGFTMVALKNGIPALIVAPDVLAVTLLSGISNAVFVVMWLIIVKNGAYMMLDVFCTIGIIIPLLGGMIWFGEAVRAVQWLGMGLLLCAVCIMCSYNNSVKTKMTVSSFIMLMICGAANGFTDFSQKMFVKQAADTPISVFNFYTYLVSAVILFVCYIIFKKHSEDKEHKVNIKSIFVYILIMSVCLFLASYFKTAAAGILPAAKLYPLCQGAALSLSAVMSAVFFHERLTIKCISGILLSFIALIIINVL